MNARETEDHLLNRCVAVANSALDPAQNQQEANVFRVAGLVVLSRFPLEAANLIQSSEIYFSAHPTEKLHAADVVRRGWVFSLPRLRDMLTAKLKRW